MIINKIKEHKKLIVLFIIIVLLFLITIILINHNKEKRMQEFLSKETERVRQYTKLSDFKSIEEVALYCGCKFRKQEETNTDNINYKIYMDLPANTDVLEEYQKEYVLNLVQYSSYVLKYKNFVIIDENKNINILVYCNEEKQLVEKYYINDIENYYEKLQNERNIKNFKITETIDTQVTSDELKQLVSSNWKIEQNKLGTIESLYKGYDIYFDEGIQTRKINGKIFNIIFTDKYTKNIVNDLNVNSTLTQIQDSLGKPQFESGSLIGYKCNDFYIFFYDKQVSIYPVYNSNKDEFANILNSFKSNEDIKKMITEVKSIWKDYDIYEYDENFVKLQYTLKGVCINYDSSAKRGIIFYNNYNGKIYENTDLSEVLKGDKQLLNNMYIENKDLVFGTEKNRINTLDDTSKNNNYSSAVVLNTSKEFKIYKSSINKNEGSYKIGFISIDNKYPNSELKENINNGIWYDDYNFIYSIKQKGIYVYNAQTRTYKTIVTGNENFEINNYDNKTLYYDGISIEINL